MIVQKEKLLISLKNQGYSDEIIKAFAKIDREFFVQDKVKIYSYDDIAIPLDDGSTISQPSTIAFTLSLLEPKQGQSILEIGSGSGYVLALISEIVKNGKIYGLEINQNLAIKSKKLLEKNLNIEILNRSGLEGLPEQAPFDRILISASCPDRGIPYSLLSQLRDPGIIIAPVGTSLLKIRKINKIVSEEEFPGFSFVPFVLKS